MQAGCACAAKRAFGTRARAYPLQKLAPAILGHPLAWRRHEHNIEPTSAEGATRLAVKSFDVFRNVALDDLRPRKIELHDIRAALHEFARDQDVGTSSPQRKIPNTTT